MRKLSAHYIITGTGTVLVKGIIILSDEGTIIDIIDTKGELDEIAGLEFYSGLITPGFVIGVGTDCLSSNHQLSMLREMRTIQISNPSTPLSEIVMRATRNSAEALGINDWAGTIEIGKKPGINLITGMDLQHLLLLPQSKVKRLI